MVHANHHCNRWTWWNVVIHDWFIDGVVCRKVMSHGEEWSKEMHECILCCLYPAMWPPWRWNWTVKEIKCHNHAQITLCHWFTFWFLLIHSFLFLSFFFFYAWLCIVLCLAISLLFTFSLSCSWCVHNRREGKRIIYRCEVGLFTEWYGKQGRELIHMWVLMPCSSTTAWRDWDLLLCPIVSKALMLYKVVLRLPRALLIISPLYIGDLSCPK